MLVSAEDARLHAENADVVFADERIRHCRFFISLSWIKAPQEEA